MSAFKALSGAELSLRPVSAMTLLEEQRAAEELFDKYGGSAVGEALVAAAAFAAAGLYTEKGERAFSGAAGALAALAPEELFKLAEESGAASVFVSGEGKQTKNVENNVKAFTDVAQNMTESLPVTETTAATPQISAAAAPRAGSMADVSRWFERDARRYDSGFDAY